MDQTPRVVGIALVIAVIGGSFLWWQSQQKDPVPAPAPPPPPPVVAPRPPAPPAPDLAPPPPAVRHEVKAEREAGQTTLPSLDDSDGAIEKALSALFGKKAIRPNFILDGFVRRTVATIENLANETATTQRWPVHPTPAEFVVDGAVGSTVIGARNDARYAAFLGLVNAVDTGRAVRQYVRHYPLFQQAYEELGFPGQYFNDRVVTVIDHLLETPEPPSPPRVTLVEASPGAPPTGRPKLWKFEDPALERRSAGQKILLRLGSDNAAKLKAKLRDVRAQIVAASR